MSEKHIISTELRQDTTKKQINALETRIKFFQEQQTHLVPGKFLDIVVKCVMGVVQMGKILKEVIPEESQKEGIDLYQKLLLSF